jgi:hypothetical protein
MLLRIVHAFSVVELLHAHLVIKATLILAFNATMVFT